MAIIRIIAEGEHERVLREASNVRFLRRILDDAGDLKSLVWIATIDPYGDTVFNRLQIPRLLHEWESLMPLTQSQEEIGAMEEVRDLAKYCLTKPHRYLRFYGD